MSGRKSRDKGARFERDIAKKLTEASGKTWRRTPLSGGWAKEKVSGDLVCTESEAMLSFELKNQESWTFDSLPESQEPFATWWKQAEDAANQYKPPKLPAVIFTKNRRGIYIMYSLEMNQYFDETTVTMDKTCWELSFGRFIIITLAKFLKYIDWEKVLSGLNGTSRLHS